MVKSMSHGSVVVDLAAVQGGNCALTEPNKIVVKNGVKIIGYTNIPGTVPIHSTQMFSSNILAFLLNITKEGKLNINNEDYITSSTLITKDGKIVNEKIRGYK